MNWKIKITASARVDIKDIKKWYGKESIWALENFTKELVAALGRLQKGLREYRTVYQDYHRISLKKFPYIIYYQRNETEKTVTVNAVFHNRRKEEDVEK